MKKHLKKLKREFTMDFTRQDLSDYLGRTTALSMFIQFRKNNLGHCKMGKYRSHNPHTKEKYEVIASIIHFNPYEVIEYYMNKIKEYETNPLLVARPLYIKAWKRYVEVAKYFKEKKR